MSNLDDLPQATFAYLKSAEAGAARAAGDTEQAYRILAYTIAESTDEGDRTLLRTVMSEWRNA